MWFWQTQCMRWTENPQNVVQLHEITQIVQGRSSVGQSATFGMQKSQVRVLLPLQKTLGSSSVGQSNGLYMGSKPQQKSVWYDRKIKWFKSIHIANPQVVGSSPSYPAKVEVASYCVVQLHSVRKGIMVQQSCTSKGFNFYIGYGSAWCGHLTVTQE